LSLAAFLLALLSKAAVVMLPFVLLGCVWWMRSRLRWQDFMGSLPFFVLSLCSGLLTIWYQYHRVSGGLAVQAPGFAYRLAAAGWAPWFYLYKAVLPFNLMAVYPKWEINVSHWVSYMPGVILIGSLVVFWWKRKTWGRPLLFGLGYFVVTLFPVLGFIQQGPSRLTGVADHWDHWQYYSIVGVIALAVADGERICRRLGKRGQLVGILASVVMLVILGAAGWRRSSVYADEETLWKDNLARNQGAWAHNNLGWVFQQQGKLGDAIGQYEQALRIDADCTEAHYNLGVALSQVGRLEDAIKQWQQALRLEPNYTEAHFNLGVALERTGKREEAIKHYEQALRIKPDHAEALNNLGIALEQAGKTQQAIGRFEQALRFIPDSADAHNNLGNALVKVGRYEDAIRQYEQALHIKPGNARTHVNFGIAWGQAGKLKNAITEW